MIEAHQEANIEDLNTEKAVISLIIETFNEHKLQGHQVNRILEYLQSFSDSHLFYDVLKSGEMTWDKITA